MGGLTGAVTSQRVTEVCKGLLALVGNQRMSAKAKVGLTARLTGRAGAKAGLSDLAVASGSTSPVPTKRRIASSTEPIFITCSHEHLRS